MAHSDVKTHYDSLVAADKLKYDPLQVRVVKNLQTLQNKLKQYEPHKPGLFEKVHPVSQNRHALNKLVYQTMSFCEYGAPPLKKERAYDIIISCILDNFLQLFGPKQKVENKIKGIYMYGSVGKVVIAVFRLMHTLLILSGGYVASFRCGQDYVDGLVL